MRHDDSTTRGGAGARFRAGLAGCAVAMGLVGSLWCVTPARAAGCDPTTTEAALEHVPWGQQRLAPDRVWPLTTGAGVTVAVIDSGVSDASEVLRGKVSEGADLVGDGHDAGCDLVGHGTSIAGIIAGRQDPDAPFTGMAPDAEILSIRVMPDLRQVNSTELSDHLATAIRQAADAGAQVINLSVQVNHSTRLEKAVKYAADAGAVLVAAAGNEGGDTNRPQYPAGYDNDAVLAVAGVNPDGTPAATSNSGDYLDVAAPGQYIDGPGPRGEGYTGGESSSGTSFATAFVSGAAALVRAALPDAPPEEIAARIAATAEHPPGIWTPDLGFGMIDPYRAVTADLHREQTPPDRLGPVMLLRPDDQWWPRGVAGGLVVSTVAFVVLLLVGRTVFRRRRRRQSTTD